MEFINHTIWNTELVNILGSQNSGLRMSAPPLSISINLYILKTGGAPYPGYNSKQVADLLRQRYRMQKPEHCSEVL